MEYKGRLFGRIHNKYFDTGKTADDWDNLEQKIKELEYQLESGAKYVCDEHLSNRIKEQEVLLEACKAEKEKLTERNQELKHFNSLMKRDLEKQGEELDILRKEREGLENKILQMTGLGKQK